MCALATLTPPPFDADLLSAAPLTLTRLTLRVDMLSFTFFGQYLAPRPQVVYLALRLRRSSPVAGEVTSTAAPHLITLAASPALQPHWLSVVW
jgi:hypothetical protein